MFSLITSQEPHTGRFLMLSSRIPPRDTLRNLLCTEKKNKNLQGY